MRTVIICLALCALPLFLAACEYTKNITESLGIQTQLHSATSENLLDDGCPKIKAVQELASMIKFAEGSTPSEQNMHSRMDITNVTRTCQFENKTMTVDVVLDFKAIRGQNRPGSDTATYPFFVAVTTPAGQIIAKEVFEISIEFPADGTPVLHQEKLRHVIPVTSNADGAEHIIMAGMQLTPSQLSFNRNLIREQIEAKKAAQKKAASTPSQTTAQTTAQHNASALDVTDKAPPPAPVQIQPLSEPTPLSAESLISGGNPSAQPQQPSQQTYQPHEHF